MKDTDSRAAGVMQSTNCKRNVSFIFNFSHVNVWTDYTLSFIMAAMDLISLDTTGGLWIGQSRSQN